MELRGSVFDYARAAARAMRPGGAFVVCFAAQDPRGAEALVAAGLSVRRRLDVVFRADQPPMVSVFVATREPGDCVAEAPLYIRDQDGRWTEPYYALREEMGVRVRGA